MVTDAHLHLTDPEMDRNSDEVTCCELLFSNTSSPKEFDVLKGLASENYRIVPFYGTHPWFLKEYDAQALESVLISDARANVGEIGLDTKHGDMGEQMPVFIEQLDLAQRYDRIVSIHMVGSEEHILRELRKRKVISILHSYSSPSGYTEAFSRCGCFFSISPRLMNRHTDKIKSVLVSIPSDRLLIESDSPNGNGMGLHQLAGSIAGYMGTSCDAIIQMTTENARRLLM